MFVSVSCHIQTQAYRKNYKREGERISPWKFCLLANNHEIIFALKIRCQCREKWRSLPWNQHFVLFKGAAAPGPRLVRLCIQARKLHLELSKLQCLISLEMLLGLTEYIFLHKNPCTPLWAILMNTWPFLLANVSDIIYNYNGKFSCVELSW